SHNRNPTGKNQHKQCPSANDPELQKLLVEYHRRGVTSPHCAKQLLKREHDIAISPASVARCRSKMGLKGSQLTTRETPDAVK
ncbi:hypothetical protein K439DRAFT_1552445, partial [Ramaria rubella]